MQISKRTIDILKNFNIVQSSIFFDEFNVIKQMSLAGNIIAVADIEEELPKFGIYNLSEFLGMINLFNIEETDFEFGEKFLTVKSGRRNFRYLYTDMDLLPTYGKIKESEKYKAFDKFDSYFTMTENDIATVKKASSILKLSHININMEDTTGIFTIKDEESNSNTFKIDIEGEGKCDVSFNVENLILVPGNYQVLISQNKVIKFEHESKELFYFISPKV